MGEVYRSRDTRLDRVVAIKVLAAHLADRADLRERFEREARAVSSLNHPNICTLYDVGKQDGTHFLVMEYVEGETLADRLQRGPVPLDQALKYAVEIADALDKAHRQGIIHRDLKPGNIMITKSGTKLLDFGLARLLQSGPTPALSAASAIPTNASGLTVQGTILGTLQYMSPEQLEGRDADARTDIFAFGGVLYELVTGRKAFEGKSQVSLMGAILEREPAPITTIQPAIPVALDRIVRKCLAKDPDERWQTASDLKSELRWILDAESSRQAETVQTASLATRKPSRQWKIVAAVMSLISIGLAAGLYVATRPAVPAAVRFVVTPPDKTDFESGVQNNTGAAAGAISPDGRRLAFTARDAAGKVLLWVRPLDALTAQPLSGTDGAGWPFWSPDSKWIGFFAQGKLKKIDITGAPPQILCDAPGGRGGAWNKDGVIVFSPGNSSPLSRVSASGGEPVVLTKLAAGQTGQRLPAFLPDGKHFIYFAMGSPETSAVYVASIDSPEPRLLVHADSAALYSPAGYLLFIRQGTLLAQAFDAAKMQLNGDPVRIAEQVLYTAGSRGFSISDNGVLVYRTGTADINLQLSWFDRTGKLVDVFGRPGIYVGLSLAPDGKRVAVHQHENGGDIWVIESAKGPVSRLTFNSMQDNSTPLWSPDGKRIAFASLRNGKWGIYLKSADGTGDEELLLESESVKAPMSWSADGNFIAYYVNDPKTKEDIWVLPLSGEKKPFPILQTPFSERYPQISPDGKWIAYDSNETGKSEIYVRPFPTGAGKWQISTSSAAGAVGATWRRDGKELFFFDGATNAGKMMAVDIRTAGASLEHGTPHELFSTSVAAPSHSVAFSPLAVSPDGQRFLLTRAESDNSAVSSTAPLTVVLNWTAGLQRK
jgi:serine/threonine protein kinase/Tol biopolymer transport system component